MHFFNDPGCFSMGCSVLSCELLVSVRKKVAGHLRSMYSLLSNLWFCGSRVSDPDSIRSVDPDLDPYPESGSGSRRAKITHKSRKNLDIACFELLDVLF